MALFYNASEYDVGSVCMLLGGGKEVRYFLSVTFLSGKVWQHGIVIRQFQLGNGFDSIG